MKSLELKLKERLFIVEDVVTGNLDNYYLEYCEKNPGKYLRFICKGSELTEGTTKQLVHSEDVSDSEDFRYEKIFVDYNDADNAFTCGFESFISAIEAKGWYWKNPLGDYSQALKRHIVSGSWQEAEEKTFNPEKCLIFKIVE